MILGAWTGLGFGAAFAWLVFLGVAEALDLAVEALLAEGLPL